LNQKKEFLGSINMKIIAPWIWFLLIISCSADCGATLPTNKTCEFGNPFGDVASLFSGFFFGNYISSSSEVIGRLAVGGNCTLNGGYGIGTGLPPFTCNNAPPGFWLDNLIVGEILNWQNGRLHVGNIIFGNPASSVSDSVRNGLAAGCQVELVPDRLNFTAIEQQLLALSNALADLPATSHSVHISNTQYIFGISNSPELEVIDLDAATLLTAHDLLIENGGHFNPSATIVFNVRGNPCGIQQMTLDQYRTLKTQIIWNFINCTEMTISQIDLIGAVLAVKANLLNPNGHLTGQIFAHNWNGPLEIGSERFNACLPINVTVPTTTPPPTTQPTTQPPPPTTQPPPPTTQPPPPTTQPPPPTTQPPPPTTQPPPPTTQPPPPPTTQPPPPPPPPTACPEFLTFSSIYPLNLFNVIVFEHFQANYTFIEGRIAVGGHFTIFNFTQIGKGLFKPELSCFNVLDDVWLNQLIVGGSIQWDSGKLYSGNIIVGGDFLHNNAIVSSLAPGCELIHDQSLLNFTSLRIRVEDLSNQIFSLEHTIHNVSLTSSQLVIWIEENRDLTFNFGDTFAEVIEVDASDLLQARSIVINPDGFFNSSSVIVFNVAGSQCGFHNLNMFNLEPFKNKILWNFPHCTHMTILNTAIMGSVLAPQADVRGATGLIFGTMIVKVFHVGYFFEFYWEQFNGCSHLPPQIPPICEVICLPPPPGDQCNCLEDFNSSLNSVNPDTNTQGRCQSNIISSVCSHLDHSSDKPDCVHCAHDCCRSLVNPH